MTTTSKFVRPFLMLVLGTLLLTNATVAQPYKLGMKRDDNKYRLAPRKASNIQFKGVLPPAYNLLDFMPSIGAQGEYGTCVAWSGAYYMRTIMEARKQGLRGKQSAIDGIRFSPAYLYEKIKGRDDNDCQDGASIADALDVMKKVGNVPLSRVSYPQCGADMSRFDAEAAPFRIEGYQTLFDVLQGASSEKILAIKSALAEGENAVLIGMMLPRSFFEAGENWKAAPGETIEGALGGHAMAIVGYDNDRNGGSFLIANSWNKSWGKNGFTWANAEDLIRFTPYAFQVYGEVKPNPSPAVTALQSSMEFTLKSGTAMPVYSIQEKGLDTKDDNNVEMVTYKMKDPYQSGTQFKMAVNNNKQAYIYILGSDDVNRTTKLFPYGGSSDNISPIVPPNASVLLPATNRSFTMDNQTGNDYFLVLVSEKELDIEAVQAKIKAGSGTFKEKAYAALGSDLIAPANIKYDPAKVSFDVTGNPKGSIVPLLVMIEHK
jgi:hypothetical protein